MVISVQLKFQLPTGTELGNYIINPYSILHRKNHLLANFWNFLEILHTLASVIMLTLTYSPRQSVCLFLVFFFVKECVKVYPFWLYNGGFYQIDIWLIYLSISKIYLTVVMCSFVLSHCGRGKAARQVLVWKLGQGSWLPTNEGCWQMRAV